MTFVNRYRVKFSRSLLLVTILLQGSGWIYASAAFTEVRVGRPTQRVRNDAISTARHVLPRLDCSAADSEHVDDQQMPQQLFLPVSELFPTALSYNDLLHYMSQRLEQLGFDQSNTLCATSLCGDEMNRPLEIALRQIYQQSYSLGGMAGFPFGGVTAFKKMKSHIPTGGSSLIVYGLHVGMSLDGRMGHVERQGIEATEGDHTLCCRSAILAANQVMKIKTGEAEPSQMNPLDMSQYYVEQYLSPYADRLLESSSNEQHQMMDLPYMLMEAQTKLMNEIIQEGSQHGFPGAVAVLGGIQINTPPGYIDCFMPLRFDICNDQGEFGASLL